MSDRAFPRTAYHEGVEVGRVFVGGEECEFVFGRGTQILPSLGADINGVLKERMTDDAEGYWFEVGFEIDTELTGNSAAGWTDDGNYFTLEIEQSTDLQNWSYGKFLPCATGAVVDMGGGVFQYWSRSTVPVWWYNIVCDLTLSCDNYGKSITGISVALEPVSLPGYPYAMPAQAATLQAALRTAGYTGAVVSNVAHALRVEIRNYVWENNSYYRFPFAATLSGGNVTDVYDRFGTRISLPGYPYAMPASRATLQSALRTAGHSGAVVTLYGDEWTIDLPDRPAANNTDRQFSLTYTPDDPYPAWDWSGVYMGNMSANIALGTSGNVRPSAGGSGALEANKQFARLRIRAGTRYDPYLLP